MSAIGLGSRAIIGSFYNRLEVSSGLSWVPKIAMKMDSNQESETYKWLGMAPAMREWIGGRQAKGLRENGLTILNKTFEATLEVLVDEIRRDKTGQVMIRVGELAERTVTHDAALLSTLIDGNGLCYDGQNFFDTDHTDSGAPNQTNQSNDVTFDISDNIPSGTGGTASTPTPRTMQGAILYGISKMLAFLDDQGEPMNELARGFLVMVSPNLMGPTMAAIANPVLDGSATNTLVSMRDFRIEAAINPRFGSGWDSKFAIFRTDGQVKPTILQYEEDVTVSAIAEGSEEEFKNNRHLYGVKKIANVGFGYWQQACRVTIQA